MGQAKDAFNAIRNIGRLARRDPVGALISIVVSPFTVGPRIISMVFGYLFILVVTWALITYFFLALFHIQRSATTDLWVTTGVALFGVVFLYRIITHSLIARFGDIGGDTHGSARFATPDELAKLTGAGKGTGPVSKSGVGTGSNSGLLIGRDPKSGKLLHYDGPAHLLTMAPTRTGKGVGTIIPNLLTADRSVICIDPKGENARVTSAAREKFGPVYILDPFGITGEFSIAFNPMDSLDPDSPDLAEDANTLADALVMDEPGSTGEAHWNEEAKALIAGLILHIVCHEPLSRRTLMTLREHLTLAPDAFTTLLKHMQASQGASGLVTRAANRHFGKSDREAAGVLSTAQRHTHFLDSSRMHRVLDSSYFSFADLKRRKATVFLVLPPDRLSTYSRWMRLIITRSLVEMARSETLKSATGKQDAPVLYLLDEFAALGHLAPIERAMGLMAGYGIQLWPILQDIHQLRATYGKKAGTFLSNAGVLQVFGVNDHDSARMISDLLGQETVHFQTMSRSIDADETGISFTQHQTGRPLLTTDEVRTMPDNAELLFLAGKPPILAQKLVYYTDPEFRDLFTSP